MLLEVRDADSLAPRVGSLADAPRPTAHGRRRVLPAPRNCHFASPGSSWRTYHESTQILASAALAAQALRPFSLITRIATAQRVKRPGVSLGIKTICVGNAGVGGAGKTMVVLDILTRLKGPPLRAHPRLWRPPARPPPGRSRPA